jgi:hypothetical protein
MKYGDLYQCSKCGRPWFLYEHKRWLDRIPDESLSLVRRWNQSRLTVDASILNVLASIGGVANDHKDYIAVPCSAQNASGQQHEKALVLVSKQPPLRWPDSQKVHWADELVAAAPSPFALPLSVRRASSEKREEARGDGLPRTKPSHPPRQPAPSRLTGGRVCCTISRAGRRG